MSVRLAIAALVNSVFINVKANMAEGPRRINMGILFPNSKLPSIQSVFVPRKQSKASTHSYPEKPLFTSFATANRYDGTLIHIKAHQCNGELSFSYLKT